MPASGDPRPRVNILYDGTRDESRKAEERLSDLLGEILPAGCQARLDIKRNDLASGTKLGGYVMSQILPLVLLLMVLLGAFYPAIDVTAGERERGTLETILSSPVNRHDLLLGKVLAVTILASVTGVLNLVSMSLTMVQVMNLADPQNVPPIPWARAAATTLVIVPSAFLAASLFVAIGCLARGFKEAQNLLMPAYVLILVPASVGALGEFPLRGAASVIPGMNVTLLAREIALGRAGALALAAVIGSTILFALLALAVAVKLYDSERFLGADETEKASTRVREVLAGNATEDDATAAGTGSPNAADALLLFSLGYLLLYFLFIPLQQRDLVSGLLISQWAGLLGLVLVFARVRRRSLVRSLGLQRPSASAVLGAVLMGSTAWMAVGLVSQWIVPPPKEILEQLRKALLPDDGSRSLAMIFFMTALTPAICEEAFFRGPILRGLASRLSGNVAIVLTGLLFGLFHVDVWRLLPTSLLGMMLGWIAWNTGSIIPSIAAHGINNAVLLTLSAKKMDERLEQLGRPIQATLFAGSLAVVAFGAYLCRRKGREDASM
jgi:sodium transport system permease protein